MMTFFTDKPIRLKGPALAMLRIDCFLRDEGKCVDCGGSLRLDGGGFNQMQMAHKRSRGSGGEDVLSNVVSKCLPCHMREHSYGPSLIKPCPPKEAA